jgi:hypothetical protein
MSAVDPTRTFATPLPCRAYSHIEPGLSISPEPHIPMLLKRTHLQLCRDVIID